MIYTILSIFAIVVELVLIGFYIYKTIETKKAFTKKTFWYALPIFCVTVFLYILGFVYTEKTVSVFVVLKIISEAIETFVFKVPVDRVNALALANSWFYSATAIAVILMGLTFIASAIALFGSSLWNLIKSIVAINKNTEFVLGTSPLALDYAKNNKAIVICFKDKKKAKELIADGYTVISCDLEKSNSFLIKRLKKKENCEHQFVAFANGDLSYAKLIDWFINSFNNIDKNYFTLHIEASLTEMDVINRKFIDPKKQTNICIKSFNKYELLSRKFIIEHPISINLPKDFYGNYNTIKDDKKINVIFIGFGKVNYELMKLMIIQNQFVGLNKEKTKFVNFPVNYYVFDNEKKQLYTEMIHRLQKGIEHFASPDLPLPENICNVISPKEMNIYSQEFSEEIDKIITDKNAYTYLIVSVGCDYENMSYAEQLNDIYGKYNVKIFTRIKEIQTLTDNKSSIVPFGYEKDLLTRNVIVNETLDSLARSINNKYQGKTSKEIENEIQDYNTRPTIERYSNTYHAMSIFFKVGLLGLKFVEKDNTAKLTTLTKDELKKKYEGLIEGIDYSKYFKLDVWNMLGFSEHSRWAAQYVLKGFRPMPLDEIYEDKDDEGQIKFIGKKIEERKHCCLTDYYSLDKYHKYLLKKYIDSGVQKTIDNVETYKYDYMFINDSYDDMIKNGYVLIDMYPKDTDKKKENSNQETTN